MNELLFALTAQEPSAAAPPGCEGGGNPLFMMVAVMAIFYFIVIRPQQKQMKEHQQKLARLKKGDVVVTVGGLIGTISAAEEKELTIEIADKVRVRVLRSRIADVYVNAPVVDEKAK